MDKILKLIFIGMFISGIISGCQSPVKEADAGNENPDQLGKDLNKQAENNSSKQAENERNKKTADSINEYNSLKADWEKQKVDLENQIAENRSEEHTSELS